LSLHKSCPAQRQAGFFALGVSGLRNIHLILNPNYKPLAGIFSTIAKALGWGSLPEGSAPV
jgi:hypothetical protein